MRAAVAAQPPATSTHASDAAACGKTVFGVMQATRARAHLGHDLHLEAALHLRHRQGSVQAVGVCQHQQLGDFEAQQQARQALVPALPKGLAGRQVCAPCPPGSSSTPTSGTSSCELPGWLTAEQWPFRAAVTACAAKRSCSRRSMQVWEGAAACSHLCLAWGALFGTV